MTSTVLDPLYASQVLRPIRYALIIQADDTDALIRAAAINSVIWGGKYNPILSASTTEAMLPILREFDPDFLIDLSTGKIPDGIKERFDRRILSEDALVSGDDSPRKTRRLRLGFGILPILRHIYREEVRFVSETESRAAVLVAADKIWEPYVSVSFGNLRRAPSTDIDFELQFRHALRASVLSFDPNNTAAQRNELLTPLDITSHGLRLYGGFASLSSHILFLGNQAKVDDLVSFWNIRATGRRVLFVPIDSLSGFAGDIRELIREADYPINAEIQNAADVQKGPSLEEEEFSASIDTIREIFGASLVASTFQPRFGSESRWYVGDIRVSRIEGQRSNDTLLLSNAQLTPVKSLSPRYLEENSFSENHAWAIELGGIEPYGRNDITLFSFPESPAVDDVVSRAFLAMKGNARVGRHGVVTIRNEGRSSIHIIPARTTDVFFALFRDSGLNAHLSKPGIYAQEIINKLGGLHGGCRILKFQGVREVLRRLSKGGSLTKGNMHEIVMSKDSTEKGPNWVDELYEGLYLRPKQRQARPTFTDLFEVLLSQRIIRPGHQFTCESCMSTDWYHVSEFAEEYRCRFCFSVQRVPFGTFGEWQYKADGIFQLQDSGFGSIPVILGLWRFSEHGSVTEGKYLSSTILRSETDGWETEIDFAWLDTPRFGDKKHLVIGQATTHIPFSASEIAKMHELASRLPKETYFAFVTTALEFNQIERQLLKQLVDDGVRIIPLTRHELDPYELFDRFDKLPNRYATTLEELSENTFELNVVRLPTV